MILAKTGQTAEADHPWRLLGLAVILFSTAPKPFLERYGEEMLQRDAARDGNCLGPSKQGVGELDCGLHSPI